MHKVHLLSAVKTKAGYGWMAPIELPADQPQTAALVVPVSNSGLFASYCLDYSVQQGVGQFVTRSVTMNRQGDDSLSVAIEGKQVVFIRRASGLHPQPLPYIGQLSHTDFTKLLCEIEPVDPMILDDLFGNFRVIIAGCDPETEYQGLSNLVSNFWLPTTS